MAVGKASPANPNTPTVYVFGTVNNIAKSLFRSDDNGANWVNLGTPAIGREPLCMAADRQVYGRVFIGTGGNGFFVFEPDAPTFSLNAETPENDNEVKIYPNPGSKEKLNVRLIGYQGEKSVKVILTDLSGKVVQIEEINTLGFAEHNVKIGLQNTNKGLYILTVVSQKLQKSIKVEVI